jgi:hypothetical protein
MRSWNDMPVRLRRYSRTAAFVGGLAALVCGLASAFVLIPEGGWTTPFVTMQLQLGSSGGTLQDGATSWGASAESALASWNGVADRVEYRVVRDSNAPIANGNGVNNVFWSSSVFGQPFGADVLAVTTHWSQGGHRVEADVVFNNQFEWNSYRGHLYPDVEDFHRVALHEFGHALGLDHPDEFGQVVVAIMNSAESDVDTLQSDDIAGIRALYGGGSGTTTTTVVSSSTTSTSTTLPTFGSAKQCRRECPIKDQLKACIGECDNPTPGTSRRFCKKICRKGSRRARKQCGQRICVWAGSPSGAFVR